MLETKTRKPDSEFKHRIVSSYGGHRLTWHSLDCKTGQNAKYSKRTAFNPEERRERFKAANRYAYYNDNMAGCCLGKTKNSSPSFTTRQAKDLFRQARKAGLQAGNEATPVPMTVGTPTTLFGNDIDYAKKTYYVPDGACGFAWVVIRLGNCSLARQAIKLGIGSSAYGGGVQIWISDHNQSVDRKTKHAAAYADVLQKHGVNASSQSRLD